MMESIFSGIGGVAGEVALALAPLVAIVAFFQVAYLKMSGRKLLRTAVGFLFTYLGLVLFLQGVHIGFMPIGEIMGRKLAALDANWVLVPIGLVLGFVVILAEPAVRVLIYQVEDVTSGFINKRIVLIFVCAGVASAVALAMAKVLLGIPLWYFIIPGYIIAFILTRYVNKEFIAIAFDSGGVATGPMTVTFLLSMIVGVAKELNGRDPLIDGFGMIAIVALMPILSLLLLGVFYRMKEKGNARR